MTALPDGGVRLDLTRDQYDTLLLMLVSRPT